jgi:hypothetical protein
MNSEETSGPNGLQSKALKKPLKQSRTSCPNFSWEMKEGSYLEDANFVVFGSLARCEWTAGSDLDWTYLIDGERDPEHLPITQRISKLLVDSGFCKP